MNQPRSVLQPDWFWFGMVPLIPFVMGALLLQVVAPSDVFSSPWYSLRGSMQSSDKLLAFDNLADRIVFVAVAMLQMITCVGVIVIHVQRIRMLDPGLRNRAIRNFLVTLGIAFVVCTWLRLQESAVYEFTFKMVRELLLASPGWGNGFASSGFFLAQSRTFWLALIPFVLGAITVALVPASVASLTIASDINDAAWESKFSVRVAKLQSSFRLSSLVLVTSAIALMLFVRLPVKLMDEAGSVAFSHFAVSLPVFWGAVMTLTLLVAFAPVVWLLSREAADYHSRLATDQSFRAWIADRQDLSIKRHLANLATILAPVMVGPAGSLLQTLLG